jgi:hypothetical protein
MRRPAAHDDDGSSVATSLNELTVPLSVSSHFGPDVGERLEELHVEQIVGHAAQGLGACVPVRLLGAGAPVGDPSVGIAEEGRIVREVEERPPAGEGGLGAPALGDVEERGDAVIHRAGWPEHRRTPDFDRHDGPVGPPDLHIVDI